MGIYGNYDTRDVWVRDNMCGEFFRHKGIIVDVKCDGTKSIVYYNGNSARRTMETCTSKWRRVVIWYGGKLWHITDNATGRTITRAVSREQALDCVRDAVEMFCEEMEIPKYANSWETARRDMYNLRFYVRRCNIESDHVPFTHVAKWISENPGPNL